MKISIFFIVIVLITKISTNDSFYTRIIIWGENTDKQCGGSNNPTSIGLIENPISPGNISIQSACSTTDNNYFLSDRHKVYGVGNSDWIGVYVEEDTWLPVEIPMASDFIPTEMRCFDEVVCVSNEDLNVTCWGNDVTKGVLGYGNVIVDEPKSIMRGGLSGKKVVDYAFTPLNGLAFTWDGGSYHFYSIGFYSAGILGDGNSGGPDATDWTGVSDSAMVTQHAGGNYLKKIVLMRTMVFVLFGDGTMYYWGQKTLGSGCSNQFMATEWSPIPYPSYSTCQNAGFTSEIDGGMVKDLVCSEQPLTQVQVCVALVDKTGNLAFYSWGDTGTGALYMGRDYSTEDEGGVARILEDSAYSGYRIIDYAATHYSFILLAEDNGVEKLFGFGTDSNGDLGGLGSQFYFEEINVDSIPFIKYGKLQTSSRGSNNILLLPGRCYGVYTNESVCSGRGICEDFNHCECSIWYDGLWCNASNCNNTCSDRGACYGANQCACDPSASYGGPNCEYIKCRGELENSGEVCNEKGNCTAVNYCECEDGYVSPYCEIDDGGGDGGIEEFIQDNLEYIISIGSGILLIGLCLLICVCCLFLIGACCICVCGGALGLSFRGKGSGNLNKLDQFDLVESTEGGDFANLKINKSLFEIPISEIKPIKILGEGGSNSVVYKAKWGKKTVAFKCFKTRFLCTDQNNYDEFEKEVSILGSLGHPGILQFYGATLAPPKVGIIMEFAEKGDLSRFLFIYKKEHGKSYPIEKKIKMLGDVADAMCYLHDRKVIHRDLKMENVLVTAHDEIKVMDFGLSRIVERQSEHKTRGVGTSYYMSPELVNGSKYDGKVDVFAFGIMTYVTITENNQPYGQVPCVELKVAKSPEYRPSWSEVECPEWLSRMAENAWDHDPNKRSSFSQIVDIFSDKS